MTFSLCMIVKNEEKTIGRCLDSVREIFDEIIVVDTGSVDGTKKIVSEYTDKIYDFIWCDDFAMARNFSFSKATGDYIMWLDADDIILPDDRVQLLKLKEEITAETDVIMMKYVINTEKNGAISYFYYRERLIKRLSGLRWHGFVHEAITPSGNVVYKDICVYHMPENRENRDKERNLKIYEGKIASGVKLTARETYYYARELYYNGKTDRAVKHLSEFLGFPNGWYADKIGACILLFRIHFKKSAAVARAYISRAMSYGKITPEVLCLMGDSHKEEGNINQAIFWYNAACMCPSEYASDGFVLPEYERYYPLMQLCVCYDMLGDKEKAKECNRLAGIEKPDSDEVKHNEKYFASLDETAEKNK